MRGCIPGKSPRVGNYRTRVLKAKHAAPRLERGQRQLLSAELARWAAAGSQEKQAGGCPSVFHGSTGSFTLNQTRCRLSREQDTVNHVCARRQAGWTGAMEAWCPGDALVEGGVAPGKQTSHGTKPLASPLLLDAYCVPGTVDVETRQSPPCRDPQPGGERQALHSHVERLLPAGAHLCL